MSTRDIMNTALKLVGFESVPADSAIYVDGEDLQSVLFGIDADVPELMLAKRLGCDAVISHHPKGGTAIVGFHRVFERHIQQMTNVGVPKYEAENAARKKTQSLETEMHTRNYSHAVDAARLLEMPYMNIHTPLDELGRRIMTQKIESEIQKDATVGDVVSTLKMLPELKNARTDVKIQLGESSNPAGRVVVSHGAGTNGGYEIAKTYFQHGVNTLIYIHISPNDLEKLRNDNIGSLIVTGHIASDSLGINPLIRELEKQDILVTRVGIVPP